MYSFLYLEPISSTSSSNCCFLTCIQISKEAGQVVWYSHLFKNFSPYFFRIEGTKGSLYFTGTGTEEEAEGPMESVGGSVPYCLCPAP